MPVTRDDLHLNQYLTNLSIAYMQDADQFVAGKVFPSVRTNKQTNKYTILSRADWNRSEMKPRAPTTEAVYAQWGRSSDFYDCEEFALGTLVSDQDKANADDPIRPTEDAARYLAHQVLLHRERKWADAYFKAGVWGVEVTGGTEVSRFSDPAGDPIKDIKKLMRDQLKATGFKPNKLILGQKSADELLEHPDIIERVLYAPVDGLARAELPELARLFGLDSVMVVGAIQNTAAEGAAEASDFILDEEDALLVYAPANAGDKIATAGTVFEWTGVTPELQSTGIFEIREPKKRADHYEVNDNCDMKVTGADLGVYMINVGEDTP